MRARLEAQYTADVSGQDHSFYSVDADLRYYIPLWNWYSLAFRASGGRIMGRDSDYFRYNIGGFDTLRGHGYADYTGKNMFLLNAEFRFVFIEGIKFGFPLFVGLGSIGGVVFADCGAAWDDEFVYRNRETGLLRPESRCGFRLRFALRRQSI